MASPVSNGAERSSGSLVVVRTVDEVTSETFVRITANGSVTAYNGHVDLGTGIRTALGQIVAEELDVSFARVVVVLGGTAIVPNQGATIASETIQITAVPLRKAAAQARHFLIARAAERLELPAAELKIEDGLVRGHNRSVSYGELIGGETIRLELADDVAVKAVGDYAIVGQSLPRVDLPAKATGELTFVHDIRVPGMLHGRVVRPRGQRGYGTGAKPLASDETSIAGISGARVVQRGNFVGVVAEREWDAVRAARDLKVRWSETTALPGNADLFDQMRAAKTNDTIIASIGDPEKAFATAAHVASATFRCPYQAHAPFGPNCALADVGPDGALVMSSTQDIYNSRVMLATVLGLPVGKVRVQYYEGSGTFGHSCYEDAAQAAAIMSQQVGRPVRVQFMRWDEHGWDNYGPAHLADVRAAIDRNGKIVAYEYHGWQHGWIVTENSHELALQSGPAERTSGAASIPVNRMSTGSMYSSPNRRVISHAVPMVGYLRGAALRSPLDLSFSFASEQVIDTLAHVAQIDPLVFRRNNIADPRWLGVLNAAAAAAGLSSGLPRSSRSGGDVVTGWGVGLGTHHVSYGAAVAEIEVNRRTGAIVAKRLYGALDAGLVVNPALVENQIIGQMVQATSRVLKEEVIFDKSSVSSVDWASYPILRFAEHPDVVPVVVQRLEEPSTGAGEEVMGATAAAIANAFFDATGVRLQQYPMTPPRVLAALATRRT
jgi:nicotinate dehydrogenase subunit B